MPLQINSIFATGLVHSFGDGSFRSTLPPTQKRGELPVAGLGSVATDPLIFPAFNSIGDVSSTNPRLIFNISRSRSLSALVVATITLMSLMVLALYRDTDPEDDPMASTLEVEARAVPDRIPVELGNGNCTPLPDISNCSLPLDNTAVSLAAGQDTILGAVPGKGLSKRRGHGPKGESADLSVRQSIDGRTTPLHTAVFENGTGSKAVEE